MTEEYYTTEEHLRIAKLESDNKQLQQERNHFRDTLTEACIKLQKCKMIATHLAQAKELIQGIANRPCTREIMGNLDGLTQPCGTCKSCRAHAWLAIIPNLETR